LLIASAGFGLTGSLFSQATVVPAPVTSANAPAALRVSAEPGDLLLENAHVTAVIRKRDGALVDFVRKRATLPTSDELGTTADIDGLWDLVPVLLSPDGASSLASAPVLTRDAGGVAAATWLSRGRYRVSAKVRYELAPDRPALRLGVSFFADGPLPNTIDLGLLVRWGNVSYFVEGNPSPLVSYAGTVRWAGRRGAGGDLLLSATKPDHYIARFHSRPGFQGGLHALIERSPGPRRAVNAVYELAYAPLPIVPLPPAPLARLEIDVRDERGRPLAAKATLLPEEDPKRAVFPADGGLAGADRFSWTGNGSIATDPPPGRYRLLVSAGPERELFQRNLALEPGATSRLSATLPRVVPTPGWLAADLHLHQAPSVDSDVSLEARIVAVAAEGVELAVATDHYAVTDFYPVVRDLVSSGVLARPLLTIAGSEVSTLWTRFGHFNVFPLPPDADIEYRDTTPSRLFASARKYSPNGVLQVNHPRWDPRYGYFNYVELHPHTGRPQKGGFDPQFDAIEVYNGDDAADLAKVERVLHDFIHLLRTGRRYVATGGSDSHKLAFLDPGVPRTLIAHGLSSDDDTDGSVPIDAALDALKAGNVIVTSGPFVSATVAGAGPGHTAYATGPRSELRVRVLAPSWISVSRVRVLQGFDARVLYDVPVPPGQAPVRFDHTFGLAHPQGTFVVVTVTGDDPLPNSGRGDLRPFAFTNPIWISP
jgi:hypothetical protein